MFCVFAKVSSISMQCVIRFYHVLYTFITISFHSKTYLEGAVFIFELFVMNPA